MKKYHKSYRNEKWKEFSNAVKQRDNFECTKCGKSNQEGILQVHHKIYKKGLKVWEYAFSDCVTLCKGCHAKEHSIIEPTEGWFLDSINDLGGEYGFCEKKGCGKNIRYEHNIYHPNFGYKIVGSTCVEYLTIQDQIISNEVVKIYKNISNFLNTSHWSTRLTKKGSKFKEANYSHHKIRIYGMENNYSYQLVIKEKGKKWFEYKDFISLKNKSLEQVKELSFIALKGTLTNDEREKEFLRTIYKNTNYT